MLLLCEDLVCLSYFLPLSCFLIYNIIGVMINDAHLAVGIAYYRTLHDLILKGTTDSCTCEPMFPDHR
jgi:hypothetical protein